VFICLEKIASRFSSKIIALTGIEKKEYIAKGIAADNSIEVIHCGIDIKRFSLEDGRALRSELGVSSETPLVGWVGRIDPIKGCDIFLKACRQINRELPQARYLVVGDGMLRREMEGLAQSLGIKEMVNFLGFRDDTPAVMSSLSLLVHTALYEGLGRVLLEAMACAKPVVASKTGGIPEIIIDGLNGLLVSAGDYGATSRAAVRVLRDKALAARLGNEGRKRVDVFSNELMVEKTNKLYRELM
jgi:glycosyltransferase involved in cell wall biosynthesis